MEIQKVEIQRNFEYEIVFGQDILPSVVAKITRNFRNIKKIAIITDENVANLYLPKVSTEFSSRSFQTFEIIIPAGESYKNFDTVNFIYTKLFENYHDRKTPILALGGGVVGDITGFVSATYKRGVPFIYFPTTLLSMVDASIGGKVGINTNFGKNTIGSFYQPKLVGIEITTLKTLSLKNLGNGLIECLKHGIISDPAYFKFITKNIEGFKAKNFDLLQRLVRRSINIKKEIVEKDELEQKGLREILNFGHTLGHAYEKLGNYSLYTHGEAVGLGLLSEIHIAKQLNILQDDFLAEVELLLNQISFPTKLSKEWSVDNILDALLQDKKRNYETIKLSLPTKLGKIQITEISISDMRNLLIGIRNLI